VVTVAVDPGGRKDFGEPFQDLQGRESQRGAAGGIGLRQDVESLVGTAVDEMKAVESEGETSTVSDQPFEAGWVGGSDAGAGVERSQAERLDVKEGRCLGRRDGGRSRGRDLGGHFVAPVWESPDI
jgi:hypothetical protein